MEIILLVKLHKELVEKKRKMQEMGTRPPVNSIDKNLESDRKKEQRAVTMVAVNTVVNLLLRFLECIVFIMSSENMFPNNALSNFFCYKLALCNHLLGFSYFLDILTFTSNFLFYYVFNKKFKEAFCFRVKQN